MVDIFITENNIQISPSQFDSILANLPRDMKDQALRYRRWQDAQAFALGKILLVEAIKNYGFNSTALHTIKYSQHKRPFLIGDIDFNISHAGEYIVCAISKHCKVGIDVEEIQDIEIMDFINQFTDEELSKISEAPEKHKEFFKYWTIKEAVIKADGRGLHIPLKDIVIGDYAVIEKKIWYINRIDISSQYMIHLATDIKINNIRVNRIPLCNLLECI